MSCPGSRALALGLGTLALLLLAACGRERNPFFAQSCADQLGCPRDQYCSAEGLCTSDCLLGECSSGRCSTRGRCLFDPDASLPRDAAGDGVRRDLGVDLSPSDTIPPDSLPRDQEVVPSDGPLPPANDRCQGAVALVLASGLAVVSADTAEASNQINLGEDSCLGRPTPGRDLFYRLDLRVGFRYTLSLVPDQDYDPALYTFSNCPQVAQSCEVQGATDKGGAGEEEMLHIVADEARSIYIAIDSRRRGHGGRFNLVVQAERLLCSPLSCEGCCQNNNCFAGTSEEQCGSQGQNCTACDEGYLCRLARCQPDRTRFWSVVALSAELTATDGNRLWDPIGPFSEPDAYLWLSGGLFSERSEVVDDNLTPIWDEVLATLTADALVGHTLGLQIWDADADADDLMGICTFSVESLDLIVGEKTVKCGEQSVVFAFELL